MALVLATVQLVECPKCDRWMRISEDGSSATVNVSRLKDDAPDSATLEKRIANMTARAEAYLALAKAIEPGDRKCPLMGWSSWNTFGVEISEAIILETARAMATNGLKSVGYCYVNIDDGFFNGHGEDGILRIHPTRFPNGLKPTVDGIHALGLKAGIYSDAGSDTCGSIWGGGGTGGKDLGGVGAGLYGHDAADCKMHFNDLGFDFIKVDYCGARRLDLEERARYTEISKAIRATGRTDVRFNICRWKFPGVWVADIADSWRTTEDIRANWKSVKKIIGENLYLSAYASAGHYNDMDMLEVGQRFGAVKSAFGNHGDQGLTEDEEVTHFGMWCMLSSPLLIGCDVRTLPEFTKNLIMNPYLINMNQNRGLGLQGQVIRRSGEGYVLAKDADERFGTSRYLALYNAGDTEHEFVVQASDADLGGMVRVFDLVDRSDCGVLSDRTSIKVPAHGSRFFRLDADVRLERVVYEAEVAFLPDYQELRNAAEAGTAVPDEVEGASGGVAVRYLGNRAGNDLVWKDVQIMEDGERTLEFFYSSPDDRQMFVEVDGRAFPAIATPASTGFKKSVSLTLPLTRGLHTVRLTNPVGWMPDIDVMLVRKTAQTK